MARERPKLSAKRWAETADSGFTPTVAKLPDGVQFFSPKKEGTYRLEIVPYVVPDKPAGGQNPNAQCGELHYERTYFAHRGIGADERSYVCPARTAGKPCPICEHRKELMRDKDGDEDLIKALAPKQRQLWNIYDHGDAEKGVQVWDVSFHLFGKQLKAAVLNADEDDNFEYFADPEDGLTLRVGMEEKSFAGNSFLEAASIGFKARKEPLAKEILDAAQLLDDLLIVLDYEKLKSVFLQEEGVVPHEDDDDEPAPKKKLANQAAKDDDDDDKPATKKDKQVKEEPKKETKPVTAADLGLGKGDDCRYGGKVWTIIRIAEDGLTVTLTNDDDEVRKGVEAGDLQKVAADLPDKKEPPFDEDKPAEKRVEGKAKSETKPTEKQPEKPKDEGKKPAAKGDEAEDWDNW